MSLVTANGEIVFSGTISMPLMGAWVADLVVDNPDGFAGACEVKIAGGLTLKGTVARGGAWFGATHVRVVGGAGGLNKKARAQHYRSTRIRTVLGDLARAAGETIASTSEAKALDATLAAYTQLAVPIGRAVSALMGDPRLTGRSWRMLPDGTLWVGAETWPDSKLASPDDYQAIAEQPELATMDFGIDAPGPTPGQLLGGRKVGLVEYMVGAEAVRGRAYFEA